METSMLGVLKSMRLDKEEKRELKLKNESFWGRYFTKRDDYKKADQVVSIMKESYRIAHLMDHVEKQIFQQETMDPAFIQQEIVYLTDRLKKCKQEAEQINLHGVDRPLAGELREKLDLELELIDRLEKVRERLFPTADQSLIDFVESSHQVHRFLRKEEFVNAYLLLEKLGQLNTGELFTRLKGQFEKSLMGHFDAAIEDRLKRAYSDKKRQALFGYVPEIREHLKAKIVFAISHGGKDQRHDLEQLLHLVRSTPNLLRTLRQDGSFNNAYFLYEKRCLADDEGREAQMLGAVHSEIALNILGAKALVGKERTRVIERERKVLEDLEKCTYQDRSQKDRVLFDLWMDLEALQVAGSIEKMTPASLLEGMKALLSMERAQTMYQRRSYQFTDAYQQLELAYELYWNDSFRPVYEARKALHAEKLQREFPGPQRGPAPPVPSELPEEMLSEESSRNALHEAIHAGARLRSVERTPSPPSAKVEGIGGILLDALKGRRVSLEGNDPDDSDEDWA